jgi:iron only hydrogenase large subunit-like protein
MEKKFFHHALKVLEGVCIGCTHCMSVCPTEAIRVSNGLATIIDNRCVDCGMCFRSCPVRAIIIDHDDFNKIFKYKYRIALVPAVLTGQFPEEISNQQIYSTLYEIGFNRVVEVEQGVDALHQAQLAYINQHTDDKPLISSFCPAIIRLIQVKFPSLVNNIMLLKPPLDVSAIWLRQTLMAEGATADDIGIFYVTPCAAKIAAIKSPVGDDDSPITGVINMDFLFNKIYRVIKAGKNDQCIVPENQPLSPKGILWTLTHGEAANFAGRCLAIDEIHNVMEFLEKLENDEIPNIDFLELRACDHSCAGGVLVSGNRFLTVERLKKRAQDAVKSNNDRPSEILNGPANRNNGMNEVNMEIYEIKPRSMLKLDENMAEAMRKMKVVQSLVKALPGFDCAACGSPTCQALAEDIVQNTGNINQCFYIQNILTAKGLITNKQSREILDNIWGQNKIDEDKLTNYI